ncbi:MAG: hypothetical protein A2X22_07105 [Bacteroidetes bacterium GWF2_49_14]|nr:MAG: hypothetical protein A2X22_07105 [Bacteroidetes bacterium GWF2_49_14]HBB93647.1 hypothetical protein [Bacteroidales bacterium]
MNKDSRNETLPQIRAGMSELGLAALIVPYSDPHQSEYIPAHWKFREWVSGFTGSAGIIVITRDFAGLWTDSRYFQQAEAELLGSEFQLVKLKVPHTPEHIDWVKNTLEKGSVVGLDNRFFPFSMLTYYQDSLLSAGLTLNPEVDLLTQLWTNRPALPANPVFEHLIRFAGASRRQKINAVRERLVETSSDYQFISPLDEVAWLFNLRGSDVNYCPVFVGYALVGKTDAILFANPESISPALEKTLNSDGVVIADYTQMEEWINKIPGGSTVCLAPEKVSGALRDLFAKRSVILEGMNSTTALKSIKNATESDGLRKALIRDGVAWVKTIHWIHKELQSGRAVTEINVARRIGQFRSFQDLYMGESFHPISSYGYHGAIVHYSVTEESSIPLKPEGTFLLDSGGQFLDGTTDTTRTIALGPTTAGQRTDFTLALKGTLALSMLTFPKGTKGYQVDVLSRMALWKHGKNYGHGTGHGVGLFLNVHEGPQTIGASASGYPNVTLEPGMVTTIEPAIYKDGEYGMRTENMTLVVPWIETGYGTFYGFETLTLVPIDSNLMDISLLAADEIEWINSYHERVRETLSPLLEKEEKEWLCSATEPIIR